MLIVVAAAAAAVVVVAVAAVAAVAREMCGLSGSSVEHRKVGCTLLLDSDPRARLDTLLGKTLDDSSGDG